VKDKQGILGTYEAERFTFPMTFKLLADGSTMRVLASVYVVVGGEKR
jgi:hypothetical protein